MPRRKDEAFNDFTVESVGVFSNSIREDLDKIAGLLKVIKIANPQ